MIIGAGVMGCSIATELARGGREVVVVDRAGAPGLGSTSSSSAIIRFHYSTAAATALAYEGLHYWKNWAEHIGVEPTGGLVRLVTTGLAVLIDQTGHATKCKPLLDGLGIPNEWWDTAESACRMPYLTTLEFWPPTRPDDDAFFAEPDHDLPGALFEPDAGYINDPQLAAQNLHDAAVAAGARFRFGATVTGIARNGDRVTGIELADGSVIEAGIVVNVAGPHSSAINKLAGLEGTMAITTRPMRQEVHHMTAPAPPTPGALLPALGDGDSGFYYRPERNEHLFVGSVEPECDPLEWIDDPDAVDQTLGGQWDVMTLRVARRIPSVGVPHERRGLVGVYDVTQDWTPIYDRTDLDGFYVAIGTSGNQFKNAGVLGTLMTELIEAVEAGHDHDADPLVITGRYTGLPIDLGTFARNRAINENSSMSVHG